MVQDGQQRNQVLRQFAGQGQEQPDKVVAKPMVQFKILSNKFDQNEQIGPTKVDRVKHIYNRFDK